MNPHLNKNVPSSSQVSVIRFEEINNYQVGSLHLMENDTNSEMLIPHVYITEAPLPLVIDSENINSITPIPILGENEIKSYPQFYNIVTTDKFLPLTNSVTSGSSTKISTSYKKKPYIDIIPKSSKHFAINEQIELYPLHYANKSSPIKNQYSTVYTKTNLNLSSNELNPPNSVNAFPNHPLDALVQNSLDLQTSSQPLNFTGKLKAKVQETINDSGQSNKISTKRKVQNYDSENINSITPIPILGENEIKSYPQFYNIVTTDKLPNSVTSGSPTKISTSYKNKPYIDIIPKSSKHFAINEELELYPLHYANKSSPTKNQNLTGYTKTNLNLCRNDPNPPNSVNAFPNQPLDALVQNSLDLQTSSQPLNFTGKLKAKVQETINDSGQSNKISTKRKVQNYVHISDVKVPQRAVAVLPTALLIRGKDIFPRRSLPARIRFGPVEGIHKVVTSSEAQKLVSKADAPVFLLKKDDGIVHIDVSDKDKCNWMGLLPVGGEANVWVYQENNELYAITTEPINVRRPLKLGYSKKYAEEHKLPSGVPTLDLEIVLSSNPKQWWCNECNRALPSAPLLQRHADVYHKDDIISTRRGYRCIQCRRMFSRLFTLRRHLSRHCTKKPLKPAKATEENSTLDPSSTLNDDNRLPSDESFQNFANGLDFTTSFFDTDRISNLDISGNSRADDFNPYDISFRDDICASNDLSFSKLTTPALRNKTIKETTSDTCTHCNQVLKKHSKRKHMRECPSKKIECACGRSFRNSEKLTQHFLKDHADESSKKKKGLPEKKKYTCEQCESKSVSFKRRGMLVNHLWRAHKIVSTSKVELPVRHYPCVACSKIYRSAAKRDHHIAVHHPGAEKMRARPIEGGVRSCEPAACGECPRQYSTRAKLLQHIRTHHPQKAKQAQTENQDR